MKKLLIILVITAFCLSGCGNNDKNSQNAENQTNTDYSASKTSASTNNSINTDTFNNSSSNDNNNDVVIINNTDNTNTETDIASFSTKIYTPNDEARMNNLRITCSKLNGTIVKPGETFSFCDTVGKATPEDGYQKADIFDKDGNKTKGYGGGNCQISSTLYNAVLSLPNITVLERHNHSDEVYYVPLGKDAAVAHGSIDFKFRNDYDYPIKIYSSSTESTVDIRVVKL